MPYTPKEQPENGFETPFGNIPMAAKQEWSEDKIDANEVFQEDWFFPEELIDSKGTKWVRENSSYSTTISYYAPSKQSFYEYHITFPREYLEGSQPQITFHETYPGSPKTNITVNITQDGKVATQETTIESPKSLIESLAIYQKDRRENVLKKFRSKAEQKPTKKARSLDEIGQDFQVMPQSSSSSSSSSSIEKPDLKSEEKIKKGRGFTEQTEQPVKRHRVEKKR
jgi:hypothetical protein